MLGKGYSVAAGVIYRAVLEEQLRRMCDVHKVTLNRERPTIADYNQALYKAEVYSKIVLKSVEAMAAVGNDAAHAGNDLKERDVMQFRDNLIGFLTRTSGA